MNIFPKISVITPSFQQAGYLEQTILSVLDQNYPALEFIVIDGGSTDGSVSILEKYKERLTYFVSEPDRGQVHAINKGFARATGTWITFLNSDDFYNPGALEKVAGMALSNTDARWICGSMKYVDGKLNPYGERAPQVKNLSPAYWIGYQTAVPQPSVFIHKDAIKKTGLFNESLHFVFDTEYWIRMALAGYKPFIIPEVLSTFRVHGESKTGQGYSAFYNEQKSLIHLFSDHLTIKEKKGLKRLLDIKSAELLIYKFASNAESGQKNVANILNLVLRYPFFIFKRAWWGALKRNILS